jgi:hypothetical protein
MKAKFSLVLTLILFVCTGSLVIVGPVHGGWNVESSPTTVTLYDIWGASESDIYAVGVQETILHSDGTGWSMMSSLGNGDPLRDVSGNSGSNIYAVGDNGLAKYFDGNSWEDPVGFLNTSADLNGVWVSAGGEVFIVGGTPPLANNAVIFHYTGAAWELMSSGTGNTLEAVWGSSESDVFAVGANGTILHYDGFEWLPMISNTTNYLTCVWGSAGNNVFASGSSTNVHHYNGSTWVPTLGVVEYPDDLWGSSGSDVYAVGGSDYNKIDHFDGSTWRTQFQPGNHPNGVWGSAQNNVYVVGNGGMIMRYRSAINKPPFPPPIDGPLDEASFDELGPIDLYGGTYSDPENDQHDLTYFQVWRADNNAMEINETLSGGVTDYTISPGTLPSGLKYDWRVGYVDAPGAESWSETYALKIGTPEVENLPKIIAGTDVGDFGMISIVHWPDNPSPKAVFNVDYDPRNYRIGTYDAVNNRYMEFDNNLEMEPGRSYWILAREGLTINFRGIPVSMTEDVYVSLDYNANTGNGWNMVAPPNKADYYWTNVQVVEEIAGNFIDRGTVQSLADDNLYIDRRLWRWENGHYHSDTPESDTSQVMAAYGGYWVKARQANVLLRFYPGARVASLSMPEILMAGIWEKTKAWFSNFNIFSKEAVADDDDTPPMPMGGLDDDTADPVFQGCFVEITRDFN